MELGFENSDHNPVRIIFHLLDESKTTILVKTSIVVYLYTLYHFK